MAPPKNRRPGFSRRAQYGIFASYLIAILGAFIALLLLVVSILDPTGFSVVRTAGAEVTAPISSTFSGIKDGIGSASKSISAYFNAGSKNKALQQELEESRIEILEARALKQENRRLKKLLKLSDEEVDKVSIARLISSSATSARRIATLSAGTNDGVKVAQAVRAPEGLVGRILETGPNTARVLLVSDTQNLIPVKRAKDGLPAFANGLADGTVEIKPIRLGINPFAAGDLLVTSGSGGLYNPGIPVAIVLRQNSAGALGRVLADPAKAGHVVVQEIYQAKTYQATLEQEGSDSDQEESE